LIRFRDLYTSKCESYRTDRGVKCETDMQPLGRGVRSRSLSRGEQGASSLRPTRRDQAPFQRDLQRPKLGIRGVVRDAFRERTVPGVVEKRKKKRVDRKIQMKQTQRRSKLSLGS